FTESLPDSCILELDGANTTASANASWCFFNQSLSDGNHSAQAFVNDTSGRLNQSANISFLVDATTPASLSFASPSASNDSFLFQDYLYYNLTFSESNPDACLLWFNGTAFVMTRTGSGSGAYCSLNRTSLSDGQYDAFVQVNDSAGHSANSSVLSAVLDTAPPSGLTLVSPTLANNSNSSNDFLFVNLSFAESNPAFCFLSVNGTANSSLALTSADADGYCSYNVSSLPDGTYNYTLYVQDQTGRQNNTAFYTLVIDTTAPASLDFSLPTLSNQTFSAANYLYYNLSFSETWPDSCLLWQNGSAYAMALTGSGSGAYCSLNRTLLSDGQYEAFVEVNDTAGNRVNSSTRVVTLDTVLPSGLTLVSPTLANNSNSSDNFLFVNL
ncbi:MAG: Ig-like domain-containing protein, partial [Candidatus Micrarchaeota archaeon]|nr:Ig-like domain-containing protein [Candidatus Micrarchaeota archaeon]